MREAKKQQVIKWFFGLWLLAIVVAMSIILMFHPDVAEKLGRAIGTH